MKKNAKYVVVLAGPTAVGKTAMAIQLAKYFNTEIISADSRQIYNELNIGVAKPSAEELYEVLHHFINKTTITAHYNAGMYEKEVLETLHILFQKKDIVILCGGTGLYIDAVCKGLDAFDEISDSIRKEVDTLYETSGLEGLISFLELKDPAYLMREKQNPARLKRAVEVSLQTGAPYSTFLSNEIKKRDFTVIPIVLDLPREVLYERINTRVDSMIENRLETEVQNLLPFQHLKSLQTVGYTEFFDFFSGKISRETAIEKIKQHSRNYAKRQLTWFRKDSAYHWFAPTDTEKIILHITNSMR